MRIRGHRGDGDRPAGEGRPPQLGQRVAPGDQRTHAGRVAEDLVEGHGHEVGAVLVEVQRVGRSEGSGVEQHTPPVRTDGEGMLHAGVVRLRGKRQQSGGPGQRCVQRLLVDAQVWCHHGHVGDRSVGTTGVLTDPVDRVVVVGREHQWPVRTEREGLGHQADRSAGVRREDALVVIRIGGAEAEDRGSGPVDELAHRTRRRVVGVRVAEDAAQQPLGVVPHQRRRVETRTGVVQVDVTSVVETGELLVAQRVEVRGGSQPFGQPGVVELAAAGVVHRSIIAEGDRGPGARHHRVTMA